MVLKKYDNPDPNGKPLADCVICKRRTEHYAKGMCTSCYRKNLKKTVKKIICKSCGRERPHKAFGLCDGCHVRLHHYDKTKAYNAMKDYGISLERLRELTKVCKNCDFSKIVELHHLDGDKTNNSDKNSVGLCPNCHKMIHSYDFFEEIKQGLAKKGYDTSKVHPSNYAYRKDEKKMLGGDDK